MDVYFSGIIDKLNNNSSASTSMGKEQDKYSSSSGLDGGPKCPGISGRQGNHCLSTPGNAYPPKPSNAYPINPRQYLPIH